MSDSEQCSNRLELDLISLLVNFLCELGQIMTRYDFLWARWMILSNVRTDLNIDLISLLVNFSCELGQLMIRYDFLWAIRMILSPDSEQWSNRFEHWPNFTFGQFFMWIGANNDQIWLSMGYTNDSEPGFWAMVEPTPTWSIFTFG